MNQQKSKRMVGEISDFNRINREMSGRQWYLNSKKDLHESWNVDKKKEKQEQEANAGYGSWAKYNQGIMQKFKKGNT